MAFSSAWALSIKNRVMKSCFLPDDSIIFSKTASIRCLLLVASVEGDPKEVELVLFDKAGHGFHRWQDNMIAYRKTEDFLAQCLGGRSAGYDFFELGRLIF